MNTNAVLQVESLDRKISHLNTTLAELSSRIDKTGNGTDRLAMLRQKRILEMEIKQLRTLLHVLLNDLPHPWYYHRLPLEMIAAIVQWVTDPAEQLKLIRTFPELGPLMHWEDEGFLIFKLVYPLVARYLWTDWRDIWRLCQVSKEFMDVVLDHLKSDLCEPMQRHKIFSQHGMIEVAEECERLGRTEWLRNMPFLARPTFLVFENAVSNVIQRFLDAHGERLWACQILFPVGDPAHDILIEILRQTPNLVALYLMGGLMDFGNQVNALPLPWPPLPHLRVVEIKSSGFAFSLIERYAPQLQVVMSMGAPPLPQHNGPVRFPRLECYKFCALHSVHANFQNVFPQSILHSPIKVLDLWILEPGYGQLLQNLSPFGDTLEHLTFVYNIRMNTLDIECCPALRLPKLRHLNLKCRVRAVDGLLALTSLETLELDLVEDPVFPGLLQLAPDPTRPASTQTFGNICSV